MKMRQAHLDTKMKMLQAHLDHENEDALLVAFYSASLCCVASPLVICIVASRCRVASRRHAASRLVVDPLVIALLRVALLHLVVVSLLHRRASRLVVVATHRRIPLAPLVDALLPVSLPHRVSFSSHLVVALPSCVSSTDNGIVHLPFEAVERAVNVVGRFNEMKNEAGAGHENLR
jgi:hypothetical protein